MKSIEPGCVFLVGKAYCDEALASLDPALCSRHYERRVTEYRSESMFAGGRRTPSRGPIEVEE